MDWNYVNLVVELRSDCCLPIPAAAATADTAATILWMEFLRMETLCLEFGVNRIQGKVTYNMRPFKLQASLQARDLTRYCELVVAGHRFGKVSFLAIMTSQNYPGKLKWK